MAVVELEPAFGPGLFAIPQILSTFVHDRERIKGIFVADKNLAPLKKIERMRDGNKTPIHTTHTIKSEIIMQPLTTAKY